jgi:DNA-directed RNA polymerase specialized sigma24 family protein
MIWQRSRGLFSSAGGSQRDEDHAADAKLRQLWMSLVRIGVARGLRLPDAEDLAQESVVAGMEAFDPARGSFEALCRTIMTNRTKNLHRDRKPQVPIPNDGGTFVDPDDGPGWTAYRKQCRDKADRILADTIAKLDEAEVGFFMILAEVHDELRHGEVSEAARRAGITPQKGWDIFRKIQRRFQDLDRAILLPVESHASHHAPKPIASEVPGGEIERLSLSPISDIDASGGTWLAELRGRYRRFDSDLGAMTLRTLRGLLKR